MAQVIDDLVPPGPCLGHIHSDAEMAAEPEREVRSLTVRPIFMQRAWREGAEALDPFDQPGTWAHAVRMTKRLRDGSGPYIGNGMCRAEGAGLLCGNPLVASFVLEPGGDGTVLFRDVAALGWAGEVDRVQVLVRLPDRDRP